MLLAFTDSDAFFSDCFFFYFYFHFCFLLLFLVQSFHIQVNARSEDDLEEEALRKKLERSAGARY